MQKTGWVRKSHAGLPFEKHSVRRFCTSNGFQVVYAKNEHKSTGRFDLRQVERLSAARYGESRGVHIKVRDRGSKGLVIVFPEADADDWLRLWSSAVDAAAVSDDLGGMRDPELAAALDAQYGRQAVLKAKSSGYASAETVFSPRTHVPPSSAAAVFPHGNSTLPPPPAPLRLSYNASNPDVTGGGDAGGGPGLTGGNDADDDADVFVVTVPEGCKPGDKLRVTDGTGAKLIIEVPVGAAPGTQLEYVRPPMGEAAPSPEALLGGTDQAPGAGDGGLGGGGIGSAGVGAGERDYGRAAGAAVPGAAAPWARAAGGAAPRPAGLAGPVRAAGWIQCLPPVSRCFSTPEAWRAQQFEAALAAGELDLAAQLAAGEDDTERLRAAREHDAAFVAAIRAYDWPRAKALAINRRELDDLHDSILRVKFLEYYISHGDTGKALELAITEAEVAQVHAASRAA
eukprot:scaffold3987_cov118-Isochrysis_galbana.AAC.4